MTIQFQKCDNSTYTEGICKSEEEITEWMSRKFILILQNQMRFSTRDYSPEGKVSYESRLDYILLNTQIREDVVYFVKLTELELQDDYYQFSALTEDKKMIFSNDYEMRRSYENSDRVQMQVQWEFDLTLYRIDRDVYSILDWIGDVGGLSEGLVIGLGAALSLVNFYRFDHYLIEQLYLTKGD